MQALALQYVHMKQVGSRHQNPGHSVVSVPFTHGCRIAEALICPAHSMHLQLRVFHHALGHKPGRTNQNTTEPYSDLHRAHSVPSWTFILHLMSATLAISSFQFPWFSVSKLQ